MCTNSGMLRLYFNKTSLKVCSIIKSNAILACLDPKCSNSIVMYTMTKVETKEVKDKTNSFRQISRSTPHRCSLILLCGMESKQTKTKFKSNKFNHNLFF